MPGYRKLSLLAAALLLAPFAAADPPIVGTFTGTITAISGWESELPPGIALGTPVQGTFVYDATGASESGPEANGLYFYYLVLDGFSMTVEAGGSTWTSRAGVTGNQILLLDEGSAGDVVVWTCLADPDPDLDPSGSGSLQFFLADDTVPRDLVTPAYELPSVPIGPAEFADLSAIGEISMRATGGVPWWSLDFEVETFRLETSVPVEATTWSRIKRQFAGPDAP